MSSSSIKSKSYQSLYPTERLERLFKEYAAEQILVTSSFGGSSGILLKLLNDVAPGHPIHFLNTGYHFPETLAYKALLTKKLNLNVVEVAPEPTEHTLTSDFQIWRHNMEYCCFVNKIKPMNAIKQEHDVWVSGIMAFQNANRSGKQIFEQSKSLLRFHPLIDFSREEAALFSQLHGIAPHPLILKGFESIGCTHCTKKGRNREGRWSGTAKSECGLHA